jgi:hypothetical protein
MLNNAKRTAWLENQLSEVAAFIKRDSQRLQEEPGSRSLQLSLNSWQSHHRELQEELSALLASGKESVAQ